MSFKFQQLQKIRAWSVEQVQKQLKQNGLTDCCEGVRKRDVDGDTLIALTEGQLALWRDVNLAAKKQLLKFIEDLKSQPEKYLEPASKTQSSLVTSLSNQIPAVESAKSSALSDDDSWGTDFSDDKEDNMELPQRPPVPARPPVLAPKPENLPKPPLPPENTSYGHVKNIVSGLNLPEHSDMFDEEEYESLDSEAGVHNREAMAALLKQKIDSQPMEESFQNYESIKETQEKPVHGAPSGEGIEYYLQPIQPHSMAPPPVPDKPRPSPKPPSPPHRHSDDGSAHTSPGNSGDGVTGLFGELFRKIRGPDTKERTPTPVASTLPNPKTHSTDTRAVTVNTHRPLPPTPENKGSKARRGSKLELTEQPWYHSVDRKQSEELLKNGEDGYFLVRPSSQGQNALTLTLWYNGRLYNISIRHRPDGRYALGTEKVNEQSFVSVEELIQNYRSEKLVLYSGGEKTGRALLTSSPPQRL